MPITDTPITNSTAVEYDGRNNLDQRTGMLSKKGELRREWTGILTENPEPRHPQDFVRAPEPERVRGSPSPEKPPNYLVGVQSSTYVYDSTLSAGQSGSEIVGSTWTTATVSVLDGNGNGTGRDAGDIIPGWTFTGVPTTTAITATFTLPLLFLAGVGPTWKLLAQQPPGGGCSAWAVGNRPVASGATAATGAITGISDTMPMAYNVTTMVNAIMADPDFNGIINFWGEATSVAVAGSFNLAGARLQIVDSTATTAHEAVLPSDL
jgi:hypothetical protein